MTYGGTGIDQSRGVAETAAGYVLAGSTWSFGAGNMDGWMVGVDAAGAIQWQNTYGDSSRDGLTDVVTLANGNVAAVGERSSGIQGWVFEVDASGDLVSEFAMYTQPADIETVPAGGTVVTGYRNQASYEAVVLRLDGTDPIPDCTLTSSGSLQVLPTTVSAVSLAATTPAVVGAWRTVVSPVASGTNPESLVCGD